MSSEYNFLVQRGDGLGQLFDTQALLTPDAPAVVDGIRISTYTEIRLRSIRLASQLRQKGISLEEPIGIIVHPSVNDVITQIAVIYAGGSCVPLDPNLSDEQLESRLKKLNTRYTIVDCANENRLSGFHQLVVSEEEVENGIPCTEISPDLPVSTSLEHRTHLIHTSGTTSEPKAVQILARSVLEVVCHFPFVPLDKEDAVAHVNSTSFDVSLVDVWAPLLRGARVVLVSKNILLDPFALADTVKKFHITVMATTSAVLNLAAVVHPSAFSGLKMCMIGGEVAQPSAVKTILENAPPGQLINAYGPTECCAFALAHRVTLDDTKEESISIGKPIGATSAFILDESMCPVKDGEVGELYLGGPGVSRGYVNNPQKNSEAFLEINGLTKLGTSSVVYRTGDFVKRDQSGHIFFVGRRDNQVKIRGFRIELEAVETALLKTGRFSDAAAFKVDTSGHGTGGMLVAYAVTSLHSTDTLVGVADRLKIMLPEYMIPRIELIDKLPLNSHDKVDRKKLVTMYLERAQAQSESVSKHLKSMTTIHRLQQLWYDILGLGITSFEDHDDFFLLGGTSLQAAVLIHRIRNEFDIDISTLTLYDNSTLIGLATVIDSFRKGTFIEKDERQLWLADAKLGECISVPSKSPLNWRRDTEGRVFLTGATGFVGAFFLVRLLEMPDVHQVGCLVRASSVETGFKRLRQILEKYKLWNESLMAKLLVLPGNLEDDNLGFTKERFEEIAEWASVVFHLGARVNYIQPYSVHRAANVIGTLNILRLVSIGRPKTLHYVSSISCFGPTGMITGASRISEDGPMLPHLDALSYDHGYAQSQWVVEYMLQNLINRGFPVAVYRPGSVTGHTVSGVGNPDDFLCRLINTCFEIGCCPLLPGQRKDVVPVDYVCSAILHISSSNKNLGKAFHIVPHSSKYVSVNDTFDLIARCANQKLETLPYSEWVEKLTSKPTSRLKPLQPMLQQKYYKGLTRWEMYENMPIYSTENTDRALKDYPGGLASPPLDEKLVRLYLAQWEADNSQASRSKPKRPRSADDGILATEWMGVKQIRASSGS
ncbi:antibiotic synthetase [Histoplasma capsulatum G186AR]|uniref:Antibiotic synthetase n=1 Tax=Ajellomyces capsulatus (strain G186AR / H82 / ATCC MYA-2454 / RMSCC 2432) TaxID=447093 RepID=C0NZ06_AJECG|nr:antibiotic synthetase [Histoplasma capsulatum G186AR]EEH03446.1 antibiotic synthetase [Histoplasma capsulatum G186AR]